MPYDLDIDKIDIHKLGAIQSLATLNYAKTLYSNEVDGVDWPSNTMIFDQVTRRVGISNLTNINKVFGKNPTKKLTNANNLKFFDQAFNGSMENYINGPFGSHLWGAIAGFPYNQNAKIDLAEILGISIADLADFEEEVFWLLFEIFESPRQKFMVLAYLIAIIHDQQRQSQKSEVRGLRSVFMVTHDLYGELKAWLYTIGLSLENVYNLTHVAPSKWFHNIQDELPYEKPTYIFIADTPDKKSIPLGRLLKFWVRKQDIPERYSDGLDKIAEFINEYEIRPVMKDEL